MFVSTFGGACGGFFGKGACSGGGLYPLLGLEPRKLLGVRGGFLAGRCLGGDVFGSGRLNNHFRLLRGILLCLSFC